MFFSKVQPMGSKILKGCRLSVYDGSPLYRRITLGHGYIHQICTAEHDAIPTDVVRLCMEFITILIQYTFVAHDTSIPPTVYGITMLEMANIQTLKESVAKKHNVDKNELFVCDLSKSKIDRELRRDDSVCDAISPKSNDIFIYHSQRPNLMNWKEAKLQTFVVNNQHRVPCTMNNQRMFQDEEIGYPLLVTFPLKIPMTLKQIQLTLWQLIQPLLHDKNLKISDELPFQFWATWGFNNHQKIYPHNGEVFDFNKRNLKFLVHWTNPKQYKSELYNMENRPRSFTPDSCTCSC
eukprot:1054632_1